MSRLSVVLFILCVSYVALGAELRGTHKPGYVITPEEVPVSDIKTTGGCGPKQPCDAAKQEDLLKESSRALDCLGCGKEAATGGEDEDGTGVEMDPPLPPKAAPVAKPANHSRLDKLKMLESEIESEDAQDNQTNTSFAPCPELVGCGNCLANPECGFCRSTGKCMFGAGDGPDTEKNTHGATCPGGKDAWNAAQCESPSCATIKECGRCVDTVVCGWCPGQGCMEGSAFGPSIGKCEASWINAPNGSCPEKEFVQKDFAEASGPEGKDVVANMSAITSGEAGTDVETVVPGEAVGEPGVAEIRQRVEDAIEETMGKRSVPPKPKTIADHLENITKFHQKVKVERAAAEAMKFREAPSSPKTKWVTISETTSFLESGEAKSEGILEAAACVCNGKCEKPMEDAKNCPCDCAPKKVEPVIHPAYPAKEKANMVGHGNIKMLPELVPTAHINAGVVDKLQATSTVTDFNSTKLALDAERCAAAYNNSCSSCTEEIGCGYCAGTQSCVPGDSNGPYKSVCSTGWHGVTFTCDDYAHKADLITPNTIAQDSDGNVVTETSPNATVVDAVVDAASGPSEGASGPSDVKAASSGAAGLDDDVVDDDTTSATIAPATEKAAAEKSEAPLSKALLMAEARSTVLADEVNAMLAACKAGKIQARANAEVAGYLKLASAISKGLHTSKGAGADHDAFVAKLRKSIEATMSNIEKITALLEKRDATKDSPKASPSATGAASATGAEGSDDAMEITAAKPSFSGVEGKAPEPSSQLKTLDAKAKQEMKNLDTEDERAISTSTATGGAAETGAASTGGSAPVASTDEASLQAKYEELAKHMPGITGMSAEDLFAATRPGAKAASGPGGANANAEVLKELKAIRKTLGKHAGMMKQINSSKNNFTVTLDMLHAAGMPTAVSSGSSGPAAEATTSAAASGPEASSGASGAEASSGASGAEASSGASGPEIVTKIVQAPHNDSRIKAMEEKLEALHSMMKKSSASSGSSGASGSSGPSGPAADASGAADEDDSSASGSVEARLSALEAKHASGPAVSSGASGSSDPAASSGASGSSASGPAASSGASGPSASGPAASSGASGPSASGPAASSGASGPSASGPAASSGASGPSASGPAASSGASGMELDSASSGAAGNATIDPMKEQDKLDAAADDQIEAMKVQKQIKTREMERELKMKKANATLAAEEKDEAAKRKIAEAQIKATAGDEEKDEKDAKEKEADADKKKAEAEKKAKESGDASKKAEDKAKAATDKAEKEDASKEQALEDSADKTAKADGEAEAKAAKEESDLKAKEDKAVEGAEKEKAKMEAEAAKETEKAGKESETAELDAVKRVDADHQLAIKEQLKLDKEAHDHVLDDAKNLAAHDKAEEDADKAAMAAHEKALADAKAESAKARDEAIKRAEKDLAKYMSNLLDAEKRMSADHEKEWKAGETLAAKRHASAKAQIEAHFLGVQAKYKQIEKDAKAEAAETLKNGKDHAADLLLETMKSVNEYKTHAMEQEKAKLAEAKITLDNTKAKNANAVKRAEAVAKDAQATEATRFASVKEVQTADLQGSVDRATKELKATEDEFKNLKKEIADGQAAGKKMLDDAKKDLDTTVAAEKAALKKATADREATAAEIQKLHLDAQDAQKKISDANRASYTADIEVQKEISRTEQLKDQIESMKRDIENRKKAIADAKAIEAEELKNKEPEGNFVCPDGTKVFDLSNCPEGGGPVEKARAIAAQKKRDEDEKKRKADDDKKQQDAVKEMVDAMKELEKALVQSGVAQKAAEAAGKKGKADSEAGAKSVEGFGRKAQELALKAQAAEKAEAEASWKLQKAQAEYDSQKANNDVAQEQFKNRLAMLLQNEGVRVPALKKQIAQAQGTLKMTMATLTTENMNRVSEITATLDEAKANAKASDAAADSSYKLVEAATKAADTETKEKCARMETRAKSLETFHVTAAQQRSDSIIARAKEIMDTGMAQAANAKDTQLKAAQARFLADKGILEQEKSSIDMKITEMAAKNAAEMAKEKSFRKLEDVRIDGVRQKLDRLRAVVKDGEMHLRMKLKHAAALQQKAVNMESKEKVQPDVVHQIISNIKSETMQAIVMNKALKFHKQQEAQATQEFAAIQDKVFQARARRGDKARELIATVENTKAKLFADIHTETYKNSESLWAEAENGVNQIRDVISTNADSRKRGEHLTGPLNAMKEQTTTLLTNSKTVAALDQALALGNTASPSSSDLRQQAVVQNVGAKPEFTMQPAYPVREVVKAAQEVPQLEEISTAIAATDLSPQAAGVAMDGISVPIA